MKSIKLNLRFYLLFISVFLLFTFWQLAPRDSCSPIEHIVFFKTHKTAGSSVQNMLMRYGSERGLKFVVPRWGNDLGMGYPTKFHRGMARRLKPGLQYNIFTHHTRFNKKGIASVMPKDSLYFTILRDPVPLFESIYSYFDLAGWLELKMEDFLSLNETERLTKKRNERPHKGKIGRNQMAFDLGLDVGDFEDVEKVKQFAQRLETEFDLIMIAERLPESLILMKHMLCWRTEDIVVFHHNARKEEFKVKMTPQLEAGVRRWNRADDFLYRHFGKILEAKIDAFGAQKMSDELEELEKTTQQFYDMCVENMSGQDDLKGNNRVWNPQVYGFQLKSDAPSVCYSLTKAELQFTEEIEFSMRHYYWNGF